VKPSADTPNLGTLSSVEAWARAAERGAALLDAFAGASEAEFTDFGRRVEDCLALAGDLARRAAGASDALRATAAAERVREFRGHLGHLEAHGASSRELSARVGAALEATAALVEEIPAFAHAFDRSVRTLRNLGVATLMESARLGAEGTEFSHLAGDVQQLGERISRGFAEVLRRARTIGGQMQAARGLGEQAGAEPARVAGSTGASGTPHGAPRRLENLLAELQGSDTLLEELGVRAGSASESIQASAGDLAGRVGEILTNLQAQDATRQKLEHVRDSLRLLARTLRDPAREGQDDAAGFAAAVAGLQRTQLQRARDEFGRAFEAIEGAARGVAGAAHRFDAAVAGLAGEGAGGLDTESQGLGLLKARLDRVAQALGADAARSAQLAEALRGAARGAQELTAHVEEIEEIGLELELVAVNAITRASRTGSRGRPLAVIAREIQRQSAEARRNTGQVAARLSRIGEGAREIEALARTFVETAQAGALRIAGELQCLVGSLGDVHARFLHDAGGLRQGAAALETSVGRAVGSLTLPRRLADLADELGRSLEALEAQARARAPASAGKTSRALLEELARAYTMESQREIHRLLAEGDGETVDADETGKAGSLPGWSPPGPGAPDLGANVELF
jgi:chaperonin cofactor prefoldin